MADGYQGWGGPDALVLNAGGSTVPTGPVEELTPEQWDEAVRTNLTSAHPVRRLGPVDDVAAAVAFLLSPGVGWVTGEAVGITGGG